MKSETFCFFQFKLGEQYENWEFDLLSTGEIIENEISYEIYEFTGKVKELYDIQPIKIELLFNADVLEKVIYYFEGNLVEYFDKLFSTKDNIFVPGIKNDFIENKNITLLMYEKSGYKS